MTLDATLRLSIRKSLTDQAKFLDSTGLAHMEQELQSLIAIRCNRD